MNKADAKKIAENVTHAQLLAMFEKAKTSITNWREPSKVNPSVTLGAAWNMYYPCLVKAMSPIKLRLVRTNMIWVFGDYLDDALKPAKKSNNRKPAVDVFHEEPVFDLKP